MSTMTADLLPDLVDTPDTRPVRGPLVGVVNTLREQDRVIVTLGDLAELLPGRAPQSTARALREAGWLFGMRTRGVWGFSGVRLGAPRAPGYLELESVLARSGSAWSVGEDPEGRLGLTRRVDETVSAAAAEEMNRRSNASSYLQSAWHHAYGRNPNPSTAYHDAVRAVEAVARPVVAPKDPKATLGKIIYDLDVKPEKWETVIGDVDTVRKMMATIWKSQFDRRGTDDPAKPLMVSQPEAEAAVHMGVTLVQLFRTEAIRRVS
ncbi:MAG: hypothetical protein F4X18_11530 [Acidimicrobiia bacterium]|nr:hypothetical protein [Acidimicrobiia bacterium]